MKIDTSIEKRWYKRCPNGYHKDEFGVCRDEAGQTPENREREDTHRASEKNPNVEKPKSNRRGYGKKDEKGEYDVGERHKELASKRVSEGSDIYKIITDKVKDGKQSERYQAIIRYIDKNQEIPQVVAKPKFMVYEDGEYKWVKENSENAFVLDGCTTTRDLYFDPETREYTPERQKLHVEIVTKILKGYSTQVPDGKGGFKEKAYPPITEPVDGQPPTVLFLGGGSGAGKGHLKNRLEEDGLVFGSIDPDAIMMDLLPEWKALMEQNPLTSAYLAHDEASDIAQMVMDEAIRRGCSFTYDGTMKSRKSLEMKVDSIKKSNLNYRLVHRGIMIEPDTSWRSCKSRFVEMGRYVPEEIARGSNKGYSNNIHESDVLDIFDDAEIYYRWLTKEGDENHPDDYEIKKIMTKKKGQKPNITDEEHWNAKSILEADIGAKKAMKSRISKKNHSYKLDFSSASVSLVGVEGNTYDFRIDGITIDYPTAVGTYSAEFELYDTDMLDVSLMDANAPEEPRHWFTEEDAFREKLWDYDGNPLVPDADAQMEEYERKRDEAYRQWEADYDKWEQDFENGRCENIQVKLPSTLTARVEDDYGSFSADESKETKVKGTFDYVTASKTLPNVKFSGAETEFYWSDDLVMALNDLAEEQEEEDMTKGMKKDIIDGYRLVELETEVEEGDDIEGMDYTVLCTGSYSECYNDANKTGDEILAVINSIDLVVKVIPSKEGSEDDDDMVKSEIAKSFSIKLNGRTVAEDISEEDMGNEMHEALLGKYGQGRLVFLENGVEFDSGRTNGSPSYDDEMYTPEEQYLIDYALGEFDKAKKLNTKVGKAIAWKPYDSAVNWDAPSPNMAQWATVDGKHMEISTLGDDLGHPLVLYIDRDIDNIVELNTFDMEEAKKKAEKYIEENIMKSKNAKINTCNIAKSEWVNDMIVQAGRIAEAVESLRYDVGIYGNQVRDNLKNLDLEDRSRDATDIIDAVYDSLCRQYIEISDVVLKNLGILTYADPTGVLDKSLEKAGTKKAHYQVYQFPRSIWDLPHEDPVKQKQMDLMFGYGSYMRHHEGEPFPSEMYEKTYEMDADNMEQVFEKLNIDHPEDFRSYSLSVGDVLVGDDGAYIVDQFGFKPVEFTKSKSRKARTEKEELDPEPAEPTADTPQDVGDQEEAEEAPSEAPETTEQPESEEQSAEAPEAIEKVFPINNPYLLYQECVKAQKGKQGLALSEIQGIAKGADVMPMLHGFVKRRLVRKAGDMFVFNESVLGRLRWELEIPGAVPGVPATRPR